MKKLGVTALVGACAFLFINPKDLGLTIAVSLFAIFFLSHMTAVGWKLMTEKSVMPTTLGEIRSRAFKVAKLKGATICLSGNDGVGKTTQALLLRRHLEQSGLKTAVIWGRWPALFSYAPIFIGKLLRLNKKVVMNSNGAARTVHDYQKMTPIAMCWGLSMLFDAILFKLVKVNALKLMHDVVILDRFLPDILVDIVYETRKLDILGTYLGKVYLNVANRLAANLILDAPEAVTFGRKNEVSMSELQVKRRIYWKVATGSKSDLVMATDNLFRTHEKILRSLKSIL